MELEQAIAVLQHRHQKLAQKKPMPERELVALEGQYHKLLSQHPDHPALLFSLATLYSQTDRAGAAIALFRRAIDCGANGCEPWLNMANAYKIEHKDKSAAECYEEALKIIDKLEWTNKTEALNGLPPKADPAYLKIERCRALNGMASLYVNAGKPEKIIEWADKALACNPNDKSARWNRGLGLLESGQFREGFRLYDEAGFQPDDASPLERKLKTYGGLPKWDGTPGQTVICYGEQGVGDEVMFASMLPDLLKDCKVIVDCDGRLLDLFKRSFPEAEAIYPTSSVDDPFDWIKDHKVDAWVPMGSLGKYYRPDAASFPKTPYLKADPRKVGIWQNMLPNTGNLRVGISWAGGLKKTRFDQRTIPLAKWVDILKVPGIDWYSLQYHVQAAQEAANVGRELGIPIHHWGDVIANYDKTAALLECLDLVITVNTSLVHLCGSLGIKTWCLTPVYCAWRYGTKGPNPFYGSVEMLRQEKAGDWGPVLMDVAEMLAMPLTADELAEARGPRVFGEAA